MEKEEYLEKVGQVTNTVNNSYVPLGFGMLKGDVVYLPEEVFDIGNLVEDTGYKISVPFEQGVLETVKWIEQNKVDSV